MSIVITELLKTQHYCPWKW